MGKKTEEYILNEKEGHVDFVRRGVPILKQKNESPLIGEFVGVSVEQYNRFMQDGSIHHDALQQVFAYLGKRLTLEYLLPEINRETSYRFRQKADGTIAVEPK